MIQKCLCVIFLIAMIGCKPVPLYTDKAVFTLYVDNTYNVDKDIVIYIKPFEQEVIEDYAVNGDLNKDGVAYGGELTEIGVFEWDSLTYLTGLYDLDVKSPVYMHMLVTEDTVNTIGMSEYTWVLDEQTKWITWYIEIITP